MAYIDTNKQPEHVTELDEPPILGCELCGRSMEGETGAFHNLCGTIENDLVNVFESGEPYKLNPSHFHSEETEATK